MTMDTRTGVEGPFDNDSAPTLRHAAAPEGISRVEHWALPAAPQDPLAQARVIALTGRTGSACEHLAQALKETGRGELIGAVTGGAGHYGGELSFDDGRFLIFLPVGVSYAPGAQSWEGVGVAPDIEVPAEDALNEALRRLNLPLSAAANVAAPTPPAQRVAAAPGTRRYGIAMIAPQGGEPFIVIEDVIAGNVAAAAGLQPGDRITNVNGAAVAGLAPGDFAAAMRASPLRLVVERAGTQLTFDLSLD